MGKMTLEEYRRQQNSKSLGSPPARRESYGPRASGVPAGYVSQPTPVVTTPVVQSSPAQTTVPATPFEPDKPTTSKSWLDTLVETAQAVGDANAALRGSLPAWAPVNPAGVLAGTAFDGSKPRMQEPTAAPAHEPDRPTEFTAVPGSASSARSPAAAQPSAAAQKPSIDPSDVLAGIVSRGKAMLGNLPHREAGTASYSELMDEYEDALWYYNNAVSPQQTVEASDRLTAAENALIQWDRTHGTDSGVTHRENVDWEGRQGLLDEYRRLSRSANNSPAAAARREEVLRALEDGDRQAGNPAQSYTLADRLSGAVGGALQSYGAGMLSAWATLSDLASRGIMSAIPGQPVYSVHDDTPIPEFNAVYDYAQTLGNSATEAINKAKGGLGTLGQAAVDIGTNIIQMGADAAIGLVTGSALAPMAARVFGDAAMSAKQAGAGLDRQIAYGLVKSGIEVFTEKIFGGDAGIYGKGFTDDMTASVLARLTKSDVGASLLYALVGAAQEGAEEVVSDLFSPFADEIIKSGSIQEWLDNGWPLDELLYDFLIGAAVGGLGESVNLVNGKTMSEIDRVRQAQQQIPGSEAGQELSTAQGTDEIPAAGQPEQTVDSVLRNEDIGEKRAKETGAFSTPFVPVTSPDGSIRYVPEATLQMLFDPDIRSLHPEYADVEAYLRPQLEAEAARRGTTLEEMLGIQQPDFSPARGAYEIAEVLLHPAAQEEQPVAESEEWGRRRRGRKSLTEDFWLRGDEAQSEEANGGVYRGEQIPQRPTEGTGESQALRDIPAPSAEPKAVAGEAQEFNTGSELTESAERQTPPAQTEQPGAPETRKAADAAKELIGEGKTDASPRKVAEGLQRIADYVQSNNDGHGISQDELTRMATEVAEEILNGEIDSESGDRATYEYISDIIGGGLRISDELRNNVTDYNEWRKSIFGKVRLLANRGEAVDVAYQMLHDKMPGVFPDISGAEAQLNRILDVLESTKPKPTYWADTVTQNEFDQAVDETVQKVLEAAESLGSEASALSDEALSEMEEPPLLLDGQPVTQTGVKARGETVERGFAENVRTTDSTEEALKKALGKDKATYERLLNKDVLARALEEFGKGIESARAYLYATLSQAKNGYKLPFEAVPLARMVANQLAREGDVTGAERLIADIAAELTYGGQIGQLGRIMRQSIDTPEGKLYAVKKTVEKLNREREGRKPEITIPQELIDSYNAQTTDEGRDKVIEQMQQAIADQIQATWREKFTALRYTAMLGNLKTQARNLAGNAMMAATRMAKDRVAAVFEGLAYVISGGEIERTKAIAYSPRLLAEAYRNFANVAEETMGVGKYADGRQIERGVEDKRRIFRVAPLEWWRKGTGWAMDKGDLIFNALNYTDSLAQWLSAHGIKSIQDADEETLNRARAYAIRQAQEATFRDSNDFSEWVASLGKNTSGTKSGAIFEALTQGGLPFRRTPANVAVRAEEYSPLGVINALVDTARAASSKSEVSASDAIDQWAKAFTGSGIAAIGYIMAKSGMFGLKARGKDDDEAQEAFNKGRGAQDYSIVLPDGKSLTFDWATPDSVPFFMGARLAEKTDELGLDWTTGRAVLEAAFDPMLEMSMLSSLTDALSVASSYGEDANAMVLVAENALANYIAQIFPTLAGQFESMGDEVRQTYYTDPSSPIPRSIQRVISKASSKIPGWDYQTQDYIDQWGRRQESKAGFDKALETFASPWYTSEDRSAPVDDELQRLYDLGASEQDEDKRKAFGGVFPGYASRSAKVDGQRLTPEEYDTYATVRGQTALELAQDFVKSAEYQGKSDAERAQILGNLYTLADKHAKTAVARQRGQEPDKLDPLTALTDAGASESDAGSLFVAVDADGKGTLSQDELWDYFAEHPKDARYIEALWDASKYTGAHTRTWAEYLAYMAGKKK